MVEITLTELARRLGGVLSGAGGRTVRGCNSLAEAGPDEVAFLANRKYEAQVAESSAAAVIVAADYDGPGDSLIRCEDAYFAYREAMVLFYGFRHAEFDGLDARANIAPDAELGEAVRVGAFATIAPACRIGARTVLYPGVYVGRGCVLGADCTIYPNVTLYDGVIVGERVTIHAGTSIGHDGFGYATHAGRHHKIPQSGTVILEDDVEIGANCAIDRATMGATVIGAGTKFSDLVAIGHGTKMGRGCLLVAQVGIAGSTEVGNYCIFAGQAGIAGHIRIGDGARIGGQSAVTGDLPAGAEVWGTPAIPLGQARRAFATIGQLPEMRATIRQLQRELAELRQRLDEAESPGASS